MKANWTRECLSVYNFGSYVFHRVYRSFVNKEYIVYSITTLDI